MGKGLGGDTAVDLILFSQFTAYSLSFLLCFGRWRMERQRGVRDLGVDDVQSSQGTEGPSSKAQVEWWGVGHEVTNHWLLKSLGAGWRLNSQPPSMDVKYDGAGSGLPTEKS
jgi:hypothetical protein